MGGAGDAGAARDAGAGGARAWPRRATCARTRLISLAVEELVLHVRTLARQLFGDERAAMPVAFAGGMLTKGTTLRKRLEHGSRARCRARSSASATWSPHAAQYAARFGTWERAPRMSLTSRRLTLTHYIFLGMIVGVLLGFLFPDSERAAHAGGRRAI